MRRRLRLGDILVNSGLLTEDQLMEQLGRKRNSPLKLGEFLVNENILTENDITEALSKQLGIERYSFSDHPVELVVADLVPRDFSEGHQICPLGRTFDELTIAMVDPMDFQTVDVLEEMTGLTVVPVICSMRELGQLRTSLYTSRDDLVEDVVDEEDSATAAEIRQQAEEEGVIFWVDRLLTDAVHEGASDVHVSPEKGYIQVRFRIDGKLQRFPGPDPTMMLAIVSRIKVMGDMDISQSRIPQDGRFTKRISGKEISVRASTTPTIHGENVVLRLLDVNNKVLELKDFGLGEAELEKLEKSISKPHGLILTTGPTGSGKTTTLYSMLQQIFRPDINVMTIEDPVEYRMKDVRQLQLNHRAGMTFAAGLRSMLRQDPDVIMVGEIRDSETAVTTAQAALTGHLVLSTLHTNSAVDAVIRLCDIGIDPFIISSILQVIIAQRLIRSICPACEERWEPEPALLKRWGLESDKDATYKRGRGCNLCRNTGYKGRVGLFEVLEITEEIRHMIMDNASAADIVAEAKRGVGFRTLREDALDKLKAGLTTFEEAAAAVMV